MKYLMLLMTSLVVSFSFAQFPAWTRFETNLNERFDGFLKLTRSEKELVKIDSFFKHNRARMTLIDSARSLTPELEKSLTAVCGCNWQNDTLSIVIGVGFMASMVVQLSIYQDIFSALYSEDADNNAVFLLDEYDSRITSTVAVYAKQQRLIFFNKPDFKTGETIIGLFEGEFHPFYENVYADDRRLTHRYRAKVFFSCQL